MQQLPVNKSILFVLTFAVFLSLGCSFETKDPWTTLDPLPLDPAIEAQIDEILPKLTLEQKVGQVIQADNSSVTPEEVSPLCRARTSHHLISLV